MQRKDEERNKYLIYFLEILMNSLLPLVSSLYGVKQANPDRGGQHTIPNPNEQECTNEDKKLSINNHIICQY